MKNLTEQQILDNFKTLTDYIDDFSDSDRRIKMHQLYSDYSSIIAVAPASGKESYHNCYAGGYVEHILNVIRIGLEVSALWKKLGLNIDFTDDELLFSLMNHDLGKIGIDNVPYYIFNQSEWHRNNQGAIYTQNPALSFMTVPDRGLFLLQKYDIVCTMNEYLTIKLHDGLYDEANKAYYMSYSDDGKLRTNLPFIVSHADIMASKLEYEDWKFNHKKDKQAVIPSAKSTSAKQVNAIAKTINTNSASKIFDELFK